MRKTKKHIDDHIGDTIPPDIPNNRHKKRPPRTLGSMLPPDLPHSIRALIYKQLLDNGNTTAYFAGFGFGDRADIARSDYEETGLAIMHLILPLASQLENDRQIYARILRKGRIKKYRLESKPTIRKLNNNLEPPFFIHASDYDALQIYRDETEELRDFGLRVSKRIITYRGSRAVSPENMMPEHHHIGHLLKTLKSEGKTVVEATIFEDIGETQKTPLEVTLAHETQFRRNRRAYSDATTRNYIAEHSPTFVQHKSKIVAFEDAYLY